MTSCLFFSFGFSFLNNSFGMTDSRSGSSVSTSKSESLFCDFWGAPAGGTMDKSFRPSLESLVLNCSSNGQSQLKNDNINNSEGKKSSYISKLVPNQNSADEQKIQKEGIHTVTFRSRDRTLEINIKVMRCNEQLQRSGTTASFSHRIRHLTFTLASKWDVSSMDFSQLDRWLKLTGQKDWSWSLKNCRIWCWPAALPSEPGCQVRRHWNEIMQNTKLDL